MTGTIVNPEKTESFFKEMKRVKQHQLEDISRNQYKLILPREWVIRDKDKDKDYGIDLEVEIFNKEGIATGLVYWVQLKATESKKESQIRNLDLKIDSIMYYKQLEIPVLIVRYSDFEDRFYYKWAHQIDLFYAKKHAKTMRVSFSDVDIWGHSSAEEIHLQLQKITALKNGSIILPIPVNIAIQGDEINGYPREILMSNFRRVFQSFSNIAIYRRDYRDSLLSVTIKENELIIWLAGVQGCTFHNISDIEQTAFSQQFPLDAQIL